MKKISVFGLGYVGSVVAACLSRDRHKVIGVDPDLKKIELIQEGKAPVGEKGLEFLIAEGVGSGNLTVTHDPGQAVLDSEISFVCVGTPPQEDGFLNLKNIKMVAREIGEGLKQKEGFHSVVVRSTVPPGTTEEIFIPTLENFSNRKYRQDFDVIYHPEFMRESTSIFDYDNPPKIVFGLEGEGGRDWLSQLYPKTRAPMVKTSLKIAELIKFVDNSFHALKVVFANEIGEVSRAIDVDSQEVMDIFKQDKKLNISGAYLTPGFAFGGSCLPKDLDALCSQAKELGIKLPVLEAIKRSNEKQIQRVVSRILETNKKHIGLLGISFKTGTDDLRHSPLLQLAKLLVEEGLQVKIYEPGVSIDKIFGTNKQFVEKTFPELSQFLVPNMEAILGFSEVIILGNKNKEFSEVFSQLKPGQILFDLIGMEREIVTKAEYEEITS